MTLNQNVEPCYVPLLTNLCSSFQVTEKQFLFSSSIRGNLAQKWQSISPAACTCPFGLLILFSICCLKEQSSCNRNLSLTPKHLDSQTASLCPQDHNRFAVPNLLPHSCNIDFPALMKVYCVNFTNKCCFYLKLWDIHKSYEAEPSMNAGVSEYKVSFAFLFTKVVLLLLMPSPIV